MKLELPDLKIESPLVQIKLKSHLIYEMTLKFELSDITEKGKRQLIRHCKRLLQFSEKL